jgi:hypothetical protein
MAVGQISGPLLKSNLIRNGVDLAFDTDLLYLDVNDRKIGVKTNTPTHALTVNGTTKTTYLTVDNQLKVGDNTTYLTVTNNSITSTNGTISINPSGVNPVVYNGLLRAGDLTISDNVISSLTAGTDITIDPAGTGDVNVNSNLEIYGDLHITGIITATGTINSENVTLAGGIDGDALPSITDTYDLGRSDKRWDNAYINTINADDVVTSSLTVGGIDLAFRPGNTIYVSAYGDNANSGTHQNDPYGSIKYALTQATTGTTIVIYPGIYTEIFPMTVPAGVTVRGSGIRSVIIKPTLSSNDKDAFLLNGETCIEDLTIIDFFYNSGTNTGHAFRFVSGMTVTSKSPYIRNISVITKGSITSPSDVLGFAAGDAGRGALLDGSVVSPSSKEATCLFHAATFITPNADAITMTNGVRVEWLNSFTYYANYGLKGLTGSTGFANVGKTSIRVSSTTGTFSSGQTLTSYASDGTTVLAQGVISSVDGNKIFLTGKVAGLVSKADANGKTVTINGNARLSTAQKKFGTASLALDGSGDYARVLPTADFGFGTSNWTIELWLYKTGSTGAIQQLIDFRSTAPQIAPTLYLTEVGILKFNVNAFDVITGAAAVANNTWTHIAVSKSGTSTKLFVNGVQSGSTYTDNNNYIQGPVTIGARYDGAQGALGYIDEVRISKGVAKYTSNFAVPTSEFVKTADTVLLLHLNGTDGSTAIEDDSFILQDIRTLTGTARYIEMVDYSDFGAEVRAMASANVYGNYGVSGDGKGIVMYLIGHNFAYIGSGKDGTNDISTVIQAQEVVETNGAYIYFNSVDQRGDFRVGDLFYVNQETGQVQFTSSNINITSSFGLTLTDGTNTTTVEATQVKTGDIKISGSTIETLTTNLKIVSAGDQINLQNNVSITGDLNVGGNVTIGGNINIGDQPTDSVSFVAGITSDLIPSGNFNLGSTTKRWANVYTNTLTVDTLQITGSTVQSTTNSPLTLAATGTGVIKFENFEIYNNELRSTSNENFVIKPNGVGIVYIDSNQSIRIPSGTSGQRGAQTGGIRYNSETTHFEGYNGTAWVILDGVYDTDLNTYITAELTPGANDNVIRFYSNNVLIADINSTRLRADKFEVDQLVLDNNTISTTTTDTNISVQTTGTGSVNIENFAFRNNVITGTTNNAILTFQQTGEGYVKFEGTGGIVIPYGLTPDRPSVSEIGMVRYNTSDKRVEVFNGSTWINSAGESTANVTVGEAQELAIQYVLTLG